MIIDQDNPINTTNKDEKKLKIKIFTKYFFVFREKKQYKSNFYV